MFGDDVGEHADDDQIRDAFYDALDAAGLGYLRETDDPIVFHDTRHSFGTMSATAGIDLRRIQSWMGHADIQTTMRYLRYVPQHDDAARLTAAFTGKTVDEPLEAGRPGSALSRVTDPGRPTPEPDLPTVAQPQPPRAESVHPYVHRTGVITP